MPASADARQLPEGDLPVGNAASYGSPPSSHPSTPPSPTTSSPSVPSPPTSTLLDISTRLRPRDYTIAHLLDQHIVLTTTQLAHVFFDSPITCQHRLHALRRLRFIDRFVRNRPGTPRPLCWVSGPLSARYVALSGDNTPPTLKALRERQDRIFSSPRLDHLLGINEFFIQLLVHARHNPQTRLARWWSERDTSAAYGRRIHPDGHGVWVDRGQTVGFFVELDRGSEPLGTLVGKFASHRRLRSDGGPSYPVLFVLPSRTREQNLHRRFAEGMDAGVVVATTSPESGTDPAGAVWRLVGNGRHRLTLADLNSSHGQAGPINPGTPTPDQDPLLVLLGDQ
ncbi:MAG: hypothetical protein QOH97_3801 [Actinoplanes sp.]|jgi:hypothetical protein|nr:hypothetical protein [Actinoplanes sp.]